MSSKLSFAGYGLSVLVPLTMLVASCAGKSSDQSRFDRALELAPEGGTAVADEGPRPANCALSDGVDFVTVVDFEGSAPQWYTYDDGSALVPIASLGGAPVFPAGAAWGLSAQDLTQPDPIDTTRAPIGARCNSNFAMHLRGGPFSSWGAGAGTAFFLLTGELAAAYADPAAPGATTVPFFPQTTMSGLDVSGYQGIAFWARRGPTSQSSVRISVTDKYTNEEAARLIYNGTLLEGPYCGLVRTCGCPSGVECQPDNTCWRPGVDPDPGTMVTAADGGVSTATYPVCGAPKCAADPNTGANNVIDGSACVRFTTSDGNQDSYCYDEGVDPPPPAPTERCGDGWGAAVTVSNDWKFYRVPFNEMSQSGYGYPGDDFATNSIWSLTLSFSQGEVDMYIDDIGFYR